MFHIIPGHETGSEEKVAVDNQLKNDSSPDVLISSNT